jgi:hypothetical protein
MQKTSGRRTSTRGAFFAAHWGMCHSVKKVFMPVKKKLENFFGAGKTGTERCARPAHAIFWLIDGLW